jgi:hypothetical protein
MEYIYYAKTLNTYEILTELNKDVLVGVASNIGKVLANEYLDGLGVPVSRDLL